MADYSEGGKEKVIFAISETKAGETPTIVLGVGGEAWEYMRNGMSHTFDLAKAGIPLKIILFGGPSQDAVVQMLNPALHEGTIDARKVDFSIKNKDQPN